MRVLFHGASVTGQGGEDSYFHWLERDLPQFSLSKRGYGGCHFNDAGFLTIDRDTSQLPDVCVIDWNTTAQSWFDPVKLAFVAGILLKKGVYPVFAIFASESNLQEERASERQVIDFCAEHNLPCWDFRSAISPALHFRDTVHTNTTGAKLYSALLTDHLTGLTIRPAHVDLPQIAVNPWADEQIDVAETHTAVLTISRTGPAPEIIAHLIHGPSSPIIDVNGQRCCIWDEWSHYERPGYVTLWSSTLWNSDVENQIAIQVLPDAIDFSTCRRPLTYDGAKVLKLRGLYAINCTIDNVDIVRWADVEPS